MPYLVSNRDAISTSALYQGNYLAHHGIKGQKWGERRFQNEDGSLTPAGRERYYKDASGRVFKMKKVNSRLQNENRSLNARGKEKLSKDLDKLNKLQDKALRRSNSTAYNLFLPGWSDLTLRRANHKYNKITKKYGKMGVSSVSAEQIDRGRQIADRVFQINARDQQTAELKAEMRRLNGDNTQQSRYATVRSHYKYHYKGYGSRS